MDGVLPVTARPSGWRSPEDSPVPTERRRGRVSWAVPEADIGQPDNTSSYLSGAGPTVFQDTPHAPHQ